MPRFRDGTMVRFTGRENLIDEAGDRWRPRPESVKSDIGIAFVKSGAIFLRSAGDGQTSSSFAAIRIFMLSLVTFQTM